MLRRLRNKNSLGPGIVRRTEFVAPSHLAGQDGSMTPFCILPSVFCLLSSVFSLLHSVFYLLPSHVQMPLYLLRRSLLEGLGLLDESLNARVG